MAEGGVCEDGEALARVGGGSLERHFGCGCVVKVELSGNVGGV